ncbi:MAG: hypothetical protein NWQ37_15320 [Marivita lacus]|nr:hypothetical protein [Marivita lacus]
MGHPETARVDTAQKPFQIIELEGFSIPPVARASCAALRQVGQCILLNTGKILKIQEIFFTWRNVRPK